MLGVLLMVLKVIGIVLLSVLGLILLVILLVLNVPFRYSGKADYEDKLSADGTVSWLLHLVHVSVSYTDDLHYSVRIFGFKVTDSDKTENGPDNADGETGYRPSSDQTHDKKNVRTIAAENKKADFTSENTTAKSKAEEKKNVKDTTSTDKRADNSEKTQNTPKIQADTKDESFRKPDCNDASQEGAEDSNEEEKKSDKESIVGKLKNLYNKYVTDATKRLFSLTMRQTVRIFKHLLPRRIKGTVVYGSEDPSTTGYITAIASALYGRLGRCFSFEPVFTDKALKAHVTIKGHIRFITLILIVLRVIITKDFRTTLRLIRGKDEENDRADSEEVDEDQ